MPRYVVEVSRYDDSLEDIRTRRTYTSTDKHIEMTTEVLADRQGTHQMTRGMKMTSS